MRLQFEPVVAEDLESLFALRMDVMRESLTRLGLTNLQHSQERYTLQCQSGAMQHILRDGERVGFVQLVPTDGHLHLVQLFLRSDVQGGGVGAWVLDWAKSHGLDVTLATLKLSAANRFYLRHGFVQTGEGEFDIEYRWQANGNAQV
jgi:GNAT superfamily N-acetyltransferase